MEFYKKLLAYLLPFWKFILLSMVLTFSYVILNNVSLWVSVDFIGELFQDENQAGQTAPGLIPETLQGLTLSAPADTTDIQKNSGENKDSKKIGSLNYKHFKTRVQKLLRQDSKPDTLRVICLVILISFVLKNIMDYLRRLINRYIQVRIIVDLRNRMQEAVVHLPLSYFSDIHTSKLTSIAFNDVKSVRHVLNNSLGKMILTPMQLIMNIAILFWISWKLSLITLLIIPVSGVIIIKIGKSMRRKSRRVLEQVSTVMAHFQEAVSAVQVVKSFTAEKYEVEKFRKSNQGFKRLQMRAYRLGQATSPVNEIMAVNVIVMLLWYGGSLVYAGEFDADDFMKFLLFLFTCLTPLREMSQLNNVIQRGVAAAERIFGVIESKRESYSAASNAEVKNFEQAIELSRVCFEYEAGTPVLQDINLDIKKGETVAFVGHSGSGKTTLVNLIPRFYDVSRGEVRLDGQNIDEIALTSLRDLIGLVTQDVFLFNESVRYNIAYGLDDVSDSAVIEAAKAANAYEFIQNMEAGLDTVVGERGANLSGGQRQRLSIARAILKNPPILILDEATSALDTESEKMVQEAIDRIMKERTVLVIAHRLSTIIHADKIVVLNQGRIVGIGTHAELLKTCSIYENLYKIQFGE